jgi:hypothetical protein
MRTIPGSLCGALAAILVVAGAGQSNASPRQPAPPHLSSARSHGPVPNDAVLAETGEGRLIVVSLSGRVLARIPGKGRRPPQWANMELSPDRRHAFVSNGEEAEPPSLYELNLGDGRKRLLGHGFSPTLSPDRGTLAYFAEVRGKEDEQRVTALLLRDLRTDTQRSIPFIPAWPGGTPPEQIVNWSPDGRLIAVVTRPDGIALVDEMTATNIRTSMGPTGSQASITGLAPVFLDANTLVVLANCCIGRQRLVAVDVRSGATSPFVRLSSPPVYMRRLSAGKLLVVTTLGELAVVSRGHTRVIATDIWTAAL